MYVTRKEAIKADAGGLGIIPGSMGQKSYIVEGLGNTESLLSASHGAGRVHSRTKAKKTGTQRIQLLEKAVEAYKPLLNNFENTWEAISSTAESYAKNIMLNLTEPLFEAVKGPLRAMNDMFSGMQETILGVIRYVGTDLAAAFEWAAKVAKIAFGGGNAAPGMSGGSAADALTYMLTGQNNTMSAFEGARGVMPPSGYQPMAVGEGQGSGGGDYRTGLGVQALGLILVGFELLAPAVEATAHFLHTVGQLLWDVLAPILPPVAYAFTIILHVLGTLWEALMAVGTFVLTVFRPVLMFLSGAIGFVAMALLNIVSGIATNFMEYVIKPIIRGIQLLTDGINMFVNKIMEWVGSKGFQFDLTQGMKSIITEKMGGGLDAKVREFLDKLKAQADADKTKADALGKGAKAKVVQNFNNNRFHIDQAFAEGFDPDRVLTAVRRDVGTLAARRLSSDITPIFSDGI